jgi:hypothetical protein
MPQAVSTPISGPASTAVEIPAIPVRQLAPWALFAFLVASIVVFFVSANQGALSLPAGTAVHEWVHDGRHLLGFPCH